jgi:HUS1 checkpoint protein
VWSGLNAQTLFGDYTIESLNNNEVSFKLNLDNLHRALKSAQYATDVTMKLTKKNNLPYLHFNIATQTSQMMVVVQEVPVDLLSAQQLAQYTEPHLEDPEVHIMMPPLKSVRSVVDKMKNILYLLLLKALLSGRDLV